MADKLNALAKAPVNALSSLYDLYQRRVGQPFQQAVRGGVRGYFGLPMMSDADALGREAYRQGEAMVFTPGVGMPAGAVRLAAEGVQALPSIAGDIGRVIAGMPSAAGAAQAKDFARYQRSIPPSDVSPLTAFHGTPHRFAAEEGAPLGRFRSEKIGSGEGRQAFGYGLYFADEPGVAKGYALQLSTPSGPTGDAAKYWRDNGGEQAFRAFAKDAGLEAKVIEEVVDAIRSKGNVYTVDIPDEMIGKMLDWDKPLKDQPEALAKIQAAGYKPDPDMIAGRFIESKSGNGFNEYLSFDLQKAGIPGIRYLDRGSRGTGEGTRNIVVFPGEESKVKILERE